MGAPLAGRSGVRGTDRNRPPMKFVDGLAVWCREGDLEVLGHGRSIGDERERCPWAAKLTTLHPSPALAEAGVRHGCEVEVAGGIELVHPDPEMTDVTTPSHVVVPYRLGAIAIGVQQEGTVITRRILRPL